MWDWQVRLDAQKLPLTLEPEKYYYAVGLELHNLGVIYSDSNVGNNAMERPLKDWLYKTYGYEDDPYGE